MAKMRLIAGVVHYPYTLDDLRSANPGIGYPPDYFEHSIYADDLVELGIFEVVDEPPSFDRATQRLVVGEIVELDGVWTRQYTREDLVMPSALEGGEREPTSEELEAAPRIISRIYYQKKIEAYLLLVAASLKFGSFQRINGSDVFVGDWNNALNYVGYDNPLRQKAEDYRQFRFQVFATATTLEADWLAGRIPALTWEQLRARLPAAPQQGNYPL